MLEELIGQIVVVDLGERYVVLGTLLSSTTTLEFATPISTTCATPTRRELYVAEARYTGVQRNRKGVMVVRAEVVAVSRLEDVVDE